MNELPKPFWSRDLRPAIDALLDLFNAELVSKGMMDTVFGFLKTDQEQFVYAVKGLEQAAASEAATGTTDALGAS